MVVVLICVVFYVKPKSMVTVVGAPFAIALPFSIASVALMPVAA
jgi:uncharacterized membrane protein YccF (DUF307 family)